MKQLVTKGIILARTNYGEADRIITILTPDQGKLRLMAKGVRKPKSKLAGGIELFSVSDITFIRGKSDISTLVSARLDTHFGNIVKDIDRTMLGYELIKQLNKVTEDEPENDYFNLLEKTFESLNNEHISYGLIHQWFVAQLLKFGGHTPNLRTDTSGNKLTMEHTYNFSFDDMSFIQADGSARFTSGHIKVLRLLFSTHSPQSLQQVQGIEKFIIDTEPLLKTMAAQLMHR
jgi:DNA repair protein RecO (recombination protein O)